MTYSNELSEIIIALKLGLWMWSDVYMFLLQIHTMIQGLGVRSCLELCYGCYKNSGPFAKEFLHRKNN